MLKKLFLINIFTVLVLMPLTSLQSAEKKVFSRSIEVIDIPTADVVDHYGYHVSFRFGKEGNLQTKTSFGVFPRLNLGFGLDGERVIGTESSRLNKPTINVKFRLFDGKHNLPALAMGFDGQGYVFNKQTDEYEQREKGFYVVSTSEFVVPNLMIHVGGNIFDFDEGNSARAFGGLSYNYADTIGLMFEYDHASEYKERRINFGAKYFVTPVFTIDVAGRNTPEAPGRSKRETERIVRLNYTGSF
jgi:hypothetical protein